MAYQMGDNDHAMFGTAPGNGQMGEPDALEKAFTNASTPRLQQGTNETLWSDPGVKPAAPVKAKTRQFGETDEDEIIKQHGVNTEHASVQMG
ncbi:MAG: hypothetical protein KJ017_10930 [Alphaproteobacteria bacterium]|nr:hypothetical protein [Alphaproteobacteria bacterium]